MTDSLIRALDTDQTSTEKLAAAQTKMERSMLNITYKDRNTNIWVRERTKVIAIIHTVRKMKWSWAGHINRLKDDRWTSRVTTWRPYDKKIRQGRPAKRWRDDLSCVQKDLCRFTMSGKVSGLPIRSKRALFTQKKLDRIIVLQTPPGVTTGQWVVHDHMILCHMVSTKWQIQ